jgi:chemotaxis methyl-accepting protein methylase
MKARPMALETIEPEHDPEGFSALKTKILKERGLDLYQYKDKFLIRRFKARMRSRCTFTYDDYMKCLDQDPFEYIKLFDKLTINVTEFFRNPEMWGSFKCQVLPKVLDRCQERRIVRFWSAGCASGEEPYTIAMLVDEFLWNREHNLQVAIRGTDLDEDALKKARAAVYPCDKLRKVPEHYKKVNLIQEGDFFKVRDKIKDYVRFQRHDLISGKKNKYFDVIFCRNVIIYFTRAQQLKLFHEFHDALTLDGFMILGKTETLLQECKCLFKIVDSHERIYQKVE